MDVALASAWGRMPFRNEAICGRQIQKGRMSMLTLLKNLHKEESGQDLIEYALIAALIAVASVTAMKTLATSIAGEFTKVGNNLT